MPCSCGDYAKMTSHGQVDIQLYDIEKSICGSRMVVREMLRLEEAVLNHR
jgi:hypothetical protein